MYVRDSTFRRTENQYRYVKDVKAYVINSHRDKDNLSLISAHQVKRIIGSTKKFVLLFFRERKQQGEDNELDINASLEGSSGK